MKHDKLDYSLWWVVKSRTVRQRICIWYDCISGMYYLKKKKRKKKLQWIILSFFIFIFRLCLFNFLRKNDIEKYRRTSPYRTVEHDNAWNQKVKTDKKIIRIRYEMLLLLLLLFLFLYLTGNIPDILSNIRILNLVIVIIKVDVYIFLQIYGTVPVLSIRVP